MGLFKRREKSVAPELRVRNLSGQASEVQGTTSAARERPRQLSGSVAVFKQQRYQASPEFRQSFIYSSLMFVLTLAWTFYVLVGDLIDSVNKIPIAIIPVLATLLGVIAITYTFRSRFWERMARQAEQSADDAFAEIVVADSEMSGLIRANRAQMDAYDVMARGQASSSHRMSLLAMAVGLLLIGAGVFTALYAENAVSKFTAAGVATVGAALGGYISRTFLVNARKASETASYYFQQPLAMSYLLYAEKLVDKLPERERTQGVLTVMGAALAQAEVIARVAQPTSLLGAATTGSESRKPKLNSESSQASA